VASSGTPSSRRGSAIGMPSSRGKTLRTAWPVRADPSQALADTTEEIVYSEAVRAIGQQQRGLDELRSRTAIVLAASGLIGGLFGRVAERDGIGAAGAVAIVGIVVVAAFCL